MKTFVAQMRIRHNGRLFMPEDHIDLDPEELEALPKGAVRELPEEGGDQLQSDTIHPTNEAAIVPLSKEAQAVHDATVAAVDALSEDDFKKDGEIRAGALRNLQASLGFTILAEDVAAIRGREGA